MEEKVLVVPTKDVVSLLDGKTGLVRVPFEKVAKLIEERGYFVKRDIAERDENLRQVIPYMAAVDEQGRIFLIRRTEKQGEKRLHNKYSLGIGGHVNADDSPNPLEAFFKGKEREFNEEVDAEILRDEYLGVINDPTTEVGRVHVGVAYVLRLNFKDVVEKDQMESWWVDLRHLEDYREMLEGWSKLLLSALEGFLGHARSGHLLH